MYPLMVEWIGYNFDPRRITPVKNHDLYFPKAGGGLFTCPINSNNKWRDHSWVTNCKHEVQTIHLKEELKCLGLHTIEDFNNLTDIIPYFDDLLRPDFKTLGEKYDIIYITKLDVENKVCCRGWDVETVLICNKEAILSYSLTEIIHEEIPNDIMGV